MTVRGWKTLAAVAAVTGVLALTAWLLLHGARGSEIAEVLALPVAATAVVVAVGAASTSRGIAATLRVDGRPVGQDADPPRDRPSAAPTRSGPVSAPLLPIIVTAAITAAVTTALAFLVAVPSAPSPRAPVTIPRITAPAPAAGLPTGGPVNGTARPLDPAAVNRVFEQYMNALARHDLPSLQTAVCPRLRPTIHGFYLNGSLVGNWRLLPYEVVPDVKYVTVQARITRQDQFGDPVGDVVYSWYVQQAEDGNYYVCGWLDDDGHN